jgi:LysM repeat protein
MNSNRKLMIVVAMAAALVMLFTLSSVAFAGGEAPQEGTICVDGYVINHREVPVDGTKTDPALMVEAVDANAASMMAAVDADGYFKFEKLTPGDWNFKLQLPADWDGIVPAAERGGVAETGNTPLEEREDADDCYRIVFKIRRLFDITVIKWEELLDGSVQPGVDWEITFYPQGDPFVKKQTKNTNGSGGVVFTVTPGSWIVEETVKSGWTPVTPPKVYLTLDQYAPPGAMDPVVFKNKQPPCTAKIIVEKVGLGRDANGDLVWLGPLAGWQIRVSRADGTMHPVTKVTDGSGQVTFDGLHPGVYVIEEHVQKGWKSVSPNPQHRVLKDCETVRVLFENEEIKGRLIIDGHKLYKTWSGPANGLGLSGWKMTATLMGTEAMTSTVTDALGYYMFDFDDEATKAAFGFEPTDSFAGQTIEVCEEDRDNWIHVTPECVKVTFPYPVPDDYAGATVNFTNIQDPPLPGSGVSSAATGTCRMNYQVAAGDNLYRIAASTGSTVSAIAQANGLANPNHIRVGQALCIQ